MPAHRVVRLLVAVLATLSVCVLVPFCRAGATVPVPRPPRSYGAAIETYAPYHPQVRCAPYTRPGTRLLADLLVHTYAGTTYGTVRPCDPRQYPSEHYEGRAIDWMVSVRSPTQKAEGDTLVAWLLATDRYGNQQAMLRRLGIMYLIWDNRMWGAWDHSWHPYSSCASHPEASWDNTCHRTHVHISLSWKGAMGLTSFWTGQVARFWP